MHKNRWGYLGILALIIYVIVIWPSSPKQNKVIQQKEKANKEQYEKEGIRPVRVRSLPTFPADEVKTKKLTRYENEHLKNPDAIKYSETQFIALEEGPGETPAITDEQIAASPQLQSVVEASENPQQYPERLSPLVSGKAFDKEKYLNEPTYRKKYLSSAEPGRVYHSDTQSEQKLKRVSDYYQELNQGDEVEITVKALPNMPVSITSFDLGVIKESGLTFATVEADSSGLATFTFKGEKGTFADTSLLVSSPVTRGNLKFVVHTNLTTQNEKGEK